ncbi:hypothetical protein [Streptomyces sp. NPDC057403]|uniref:hypothetical protein n=1 Tax=Streptomyces sp. NPDC057403 TaxID=3346119 RepID=UPI003676E2DF
MYEFIGGVGATALLIPIMTPVYAVIISLIVAVVFRGGLRIFNIATLKGWYILFYAVMVFAAVISLTGGRIATGVGVLLGCIPGIALTKLILNTWYRRFPPTR